MLVSMKKKLDILPSLEGPLNGIERYIKLISDKYEQLIENIDQEDKAIK